MVEEKLTIIFKDKQEIQIFERLKRRANDEINKLQTTPVKKSSKLRFSESDVMGNIVFRALDRFLNELPAKELFERNNGVAISDEYWNQVIGLDRAFSLEQLKKECQTRNLPHTGDKKKLAWRLLGYSELDSYQPKL